MRLSNHLAPVVQKLDSTIQWISIRETNCIIHGMEIYPVDSATQLLNDWGTENYGDLRWVSSAEVIFFTNLKEKRVHNSTFNIKACILTYIIL